MDTLTFGQISRKVEEIKAIQQKRIDKEETNAKLEEILVLNISEAEFLKNMVMTKRQWDQIWLELTRLEDCIEEGIPPHSGYRKAAKLAIKKLKAKLEFTQRLR
jgi:hypothetical protein